MGLSANWEACDFPYRPRRSFIILKGGRESQYGDFPNPGRKPRSAPLSTTWASHPSITRPRATIFQASRVRPDRRRILHDVSRRRALPFRRDGSGHDGRLHRSRQDKTLWNKIVDDNGATWDDKSFLRALQELSGWDEAQINLFGQIGFGTGGWNTDFPNSILELLRVIYGGLDADHRLAYDGASSMPERLWSMPASTLGDDVAHWPAGTSVETLTRQAMPDPFCKEVRHIAPKPGGGFTVKFIDTRTQEAFSREFDCVVYAPCARARQAALCRWRREPRADESAAARGNVGSGDEYPLHAVDQDLRVDDDAVLGGTRSVDGKRKMSVTLSDRLTRGTYLVDYGPSLGASRQRNVSYTWNDDALKFQGHLPARKRCAPICWNPSIQRPTSAVLRRLGYLRENELG